MSVDKTHGAPALDDEELMARAIELAGTVRSATSPNPWVGAVVVDRAGEIVGEGATAPPGGPHAEVAALAAAGGRAAGGTLYVTLEPCSRTGRTPPCVDAVLAAGVRRVVAAMTDPDPHERGRGVQALLDAGVEVEVGTAGAAAVAEQLAPYVRHRTTGRPFVVLKLAATLDGRIAAPDGTSRWITGPEARADVHRLRSESDAVLVGAGTVRADDPELTVRPGGDRQPMRVVLGRAPAGARVLPALEVSGDIGRVLDELGDLGVLQLLVEGGARVAHEFHSARLVDRYVLYLAPALLGGDDGRPLFSGRGEPTMADAWRGIVRSVVRLGEDIRVELDPPAVRAPVPADDSQVLMGSRTEGQVG